MGIPSGSAQSLARIHKHSRNLSTQGALGRSLFLLCATFLWAAKTRQRSSRPSQITTILATHDENWPRRRGMIEIDPPTQQREQKVTPGNYKEAAQIRKEAQIRINY